MLVAAVADVHSPKFIDLYEKALSSTKWDNVKLLFFAGDMVYKSNISEYTRVFNLTRKFYHGIIVCVFGNEEYEEHEEIIIQRWGSDDVIWLRDEYIILNIDNTRIGVYGSRGVLDEPTVWQKKHRPQIADVYRKRLERIRTSVAEMVKKCDVSIVVTHYASTYRTLIGERRSIWRYLGSNVLEKILCDLGVTYAIHAHAHKSMTLKAKVKNTVFINVSLPAAKRITLINLAGAQRTLDSFM